MKNSKDVIQCCECGRIRNGQTWTELRPSQLAHASHTYCPDCLRKAMQKVVKQLSSHSLGHLRAL